MKGKIVFENENENFIESRTFAELFRLNRLEKNVTLRKISERAGVSIGYLGDLEHGRRAAPSPMICSQIEVVLGIDDGSLMAVAQRERNKPSAEDLQAEIESLKVLLKWEAGELSEGQAAKLLNLDRVSLRDLRLKYL